MKMIINLLQLISPRTPTLNTSIHAPPKRPQRLLHLRTRIRLRDTRHDARDSQKDIRIQRLEQVNGLLEEIDNFFLWGVVDVAVRVEGGDAGAVFAPFVLPEGFVVAAVVFPVGFHVGEEGCAAVGGEDGADVCVLAGFVAVLAVSTVAVIGPSENECVSHGINIDVEREEAHTRVRERSSDSQDQWLGQYPRIGFGEARPLDN